MKINNPSLLQLLKGVLFTDSVSTVHHITAFELEMMRFLPVALSLYIMKLKHFIQTRAWTTLFLQNCISNTSVDRRLENALNQKFFV